MPKKISRSRTLAYLAMFTNAIVWGIALPIVKKGYDYGLTPFSFLQLRYLFAIIFSLPIFLLIKNTPKAKTTLKSPNLIKIIFLEILGTVLTLGLLYQGLSLTSGIAASLISITTPIFVTIGGILFLKEKFQKHEFIGFTLAITGTFLIIIKPLLSQKIASNIEGNFLILAQNIAIASYYILAKNTYKHLNKWVTSHLSFWIAFIGFSLILHLQGTNFISPIINLLNHPHPWYLIAPLYMGVFGSIIGLTFYLLGQDKIEASEAAIFTYLQPIFSIPTAIILLGESISLIETIALCFIFTGVFIASKRH